MADISSTIKLKPQGFEFQSAIVERAYVLEPVADGVETVATHNIIPIASDEVCIGGYAFVETAVTSGGTAALTAGKIVIIAQFISANAVSALTD